MKRPAPSFFARARAALARMYYTVSSGGRSTYSGGSNWLNVVREPFGGAWQQGVTIGSMYDVTAFSAVFACVTGIANDIAKMCVKVMRFDETDMIGVEVRNHAISKLLRKPNNYQTRMQFFTAWILSKLLWGNAYILKVMGRNKMITALYVLDPRLVTVLVTEGGEVYYQLKKDPLSEVQTEGVVVPSEFIIHDRMNCLFHPLVGISPIYACGMSATMGSKIQNNSTKFFANMSRPSGMLSTTQTIDDVTANRMKADWESNFGGENIGRLAVLGDGLKYEEMTIPAQDAQLIEQLQWTVEDVARAFHYPKYKLGGDLPPNGGVSALNQAYYNDCLQPIIEEAELCMDAGLGFAEGLYTEFDLSALLRMDAATRMEANGKAVKDGWMKPDEARRAEDLPPVPGGDTPYLQQQNYSLAALSKRDAKEDPFEKGDSKAQDERFARALIDRLAQASSEVH